MVILENVVKTYKGPAGPVRALDGISMHVESGEFVVVRGPSGSGKTTLLLIIAGMLRPSEGSVRFNGKDLNQMKGLERERFRAAGVGFVFQMFHLIPYLSVFENVLLAARTEDRADAEKRAGELLNGLEMQERIHHRPAELSAGERQRTAIARALLNDPMLLLADEPTGNLDSENAGAVLSYLSEVHEQGRTVILATHESEIEQSAHRVIRLEKGKLI